MFVLEGEQNICKWILFWAVYYQVNYRIIMPMVSAKFRSFSDADKGYFCSSIVSTTNAIAAAYLSISIGLNNDVWPQLYLLPLNWTSPQSHLLGEMVTGYLMSDLVCTLYYGNMWPEWTALLLHHGAGIVSFVALLSYDMGHSMIVSSTVLEVRERLQS
jgi:hypothetical protein